MHSLAPCLVVALALFGCATTPAPSSTPIEGRGQVLSALQAEVTEVSQLQAEADATLNDVLGVVRQVDEALAGLAGETTFATTLDGYDQVHAAVTSTEADGLRDGYLAVAAAVDDARGTLAAARQELDGSPWEVEYLDAQDEVLVLVREYAEAADKLAQLLERHWPTYVEVDAAVADFATRRGNYRDTQEAANALAVELDTVLGDLAVAQSQIAEYGQARTASGQAVNDATADLRTIYERRPGVSTE